MRRNISVALCFVKRPLLLPLLESRENSSRWQSRPALVQQQQSLPKLVLDSYRETECASTDDRWSSTSRSGAKCIDLRLVALRKRRHLDASHVGLGDESEPPTKKMPHFTPPPEQPADPLRHPCQSSSSQQLKQGSFSKPHESSRHNWPGTADCVISINDVGAEAGRAAESDTCQSDCMPEHTRAECAQECKAAAEHIVTPGSEMCQAGQAGQCCRGTGHANVAVEAAMQADCIMTGAQ